MLVLSGEWVIDLHAEVDLLVLEEQIGGVAGVKDEAVAGFTVETLGLLEDIRYLDVFSGLGVGEDKGLLLENVGGLEVWSLDPVL